jgi:aminoglycoside phosphotransferase (APT) family kinase protein
VRSFTFLAQGWGSAACLTQGPDGPLVFRFPKNERTATSLAKEIALLPKLGPTLPVAVPRFDYVAPAGDAYPYAFVGYPFIPGERLDGCDEEVQRAEWWRPPLGAFLTAFHRFPTERAFSLGVGGCPTAAAWRSAMADLCRRGLETVAGFVTERQQAAIRAYFDAFLVDDTAFAFEPTLVHQDLGHHNLLVDPVRRRLTGVLDFASCTVGDPALDVGAQNLPHFGGRVDAGWLARVEFYRRTAPFVDIEFFRRAGSGPANEARIARRLEKINRLWPD